MTQSYCNDCQKNLPQDELYVSYHILARAGILCMDCWIASYLYNGKEREQIINQVIKYFDLTCKGDE